MQMNPLTMMQMFNQIKGSNNPMFGRAMEMAQGKSPEQLKETVMNLAKQRGIDPQQAQQMLSQFGIKI